MKIKSKIRGGGPIRACVSPTPSQPEEPDMKIKTKVRAGGPRACV